MEKIRTVIVDDEEEAREGLKLLIDKLDDYEIVAVAKNGVEAIEAINKLSPHLILLDIQMPEINGFDVLDNLSLEPTPEVIFVTAYDQFALDAFEHHAIDYLLKPFSNARLISALNHAKDQIDQRIINEKLERLLTDYKKEKGIDKNDRIIDENEETEQRNGRLVVKSMGKIHLLDYDEIEWVEAYDYYIKIHVEGRYHLVRESMKNMEKRLPESLFKRIHKSSIINTRLVKELKPKQNGDYLVTLRNGQELRLSRNYNHCLEELLQE
ncbi:MAG: LytTR family DNA-binding domain-containing protein [Cyclobacteriaceae bacterium]